MRQLGDWQEQRVIFTGFIERWQTDKTGLAVLLSSCKVRRYTAPPKTDVRRLDHIWIFHDITAVVSTNFTRTSLILEQEGKTEPVLHRLDQITMVGDVHRYTRKDGTTDYGIHVIPCITLTDIVNQFGRSNPKRFHQMEERLVELKAAISNHEIHVPFEDDWAFCQAELQKVIALSERDLRVQPKLMVKPRPHKLDLLPFSRRSKSH